MRLVPAQSQTAAEDSSTYWTTIWRVKRTDGVEQYFTSHDRPLEYDGNTYQAAVGYERSDLSNSSTLSVDNMDVRGILDPAYVSPLDLQGGRYNFAEVELSRVDWRDPDLYGATNMRTGWFGEITYDENSQEFFTELRGLTQAYQQGIVGEFGEGCPYDFGDPDCNNAEGEPRNPTVVWADEILENTDYIVDDVVRVRAPYADLTALHAPGVVDANDDSQYGATGTLGANASAADTTRTKNLAGNFRLQPVAISEDPSTAYVEYADAAQYAIGSRPFTMQGWYYFETFGDEGPILASHWLSSTAQRGWIWMVRGPNDGPRPDLFNTLEFTASQDGTGQVLYRVNQPFVPEVNRWYHLAAVRDDQALLRFYVNGRLAGEPVPANFSIFDPATPLRVGSGTSGFTRPFDGTIEDFRLDVGEAFYRENFTPPAALPSSATETKDKTVDYGDEYYRCTVAGTTGVGDPPSFGTATFVAENARRVAAQVLEVVSRSQFYIGPPVEGGLLTSPLRLINASFEESSSGTHTAPANIGAWDVTEGTCNIISGTSFDGAQSCRLPNQWTGSSFATIEQALVVSDYASLIDAGGHTVTVSYWYRGAGGGSGSIWVDYDFLDEFDALISSTSNGAYSNVTQDWFSVSQENPIPVGTRKINVKVRGGSGTGEPHIDAFTITSTLADPNFGDDAFNFGLVAWDTGYNVGLGMDVKDYDGGPKLVTLFEPMPYDITVGDTLGISEGCNREFSDCVRHQNQVNYGGFKEIPGDDEYFRVQDAS